MTYVISFLLGAISALVIFTSVIIGDGVHIVISVMACVVLTTIVVLLVKSYHNRREKKHSDMVENIWYI